MAGRKSYTGNESMILYNEVDGICPLCSRPLSYKKKTIQKKFQIAHIYPLNPKPEELIELDGVRKIYKDVNDLENVICLCPTCHTEFDKPRTKEEYEKLLFIKEQLIELNKNRQNWHEFQLEEKIEELINRLANEDYEIAPDEDEIEYDPKLLDEKLNSTITALLKRKISGNVQEFYPIVSKIFKEKDFMEPLTTETISTQVKLFYLKKASNENQKAIFEDTVKWINHNTNNYSTEAAEILASYFVQNCELFE